MTDILSMIARKRGTAIRKSAYGRDDLESYVYEVLGERHYDRLEERWSEIVDRYEDRIAIADSDEYAEELYDDFMGEIEYVFDIDELDRDLWNEWCNDKRRVALEGHDLPDIHSIVPGTADLGMDEIVMDWTEDLLDLGSDTLREFYVYMTNGTLDDLKECLGEEGETVRNGWTVTIEFYEEYDDEYTAYVTIEKEHTIEDMIDRF